MKDVNVQRNYSDMIFRMLFSEKENLLSLYNALNGTSYEDTADLEIAMIENAVYKNDISFVFPAELMLYEHQSAATPNMPLRDLFYMTTVLQGITKDDDLYGSVLINGEKRGKELGLRQGKEPGLKHGEERFNMLNKKLLDENRMEDLKISALPMKNIVKNYLQNTISKVLLFVINSLLQSKQKLRSYP